MTNSQNLIPAAAYGRYSSHLQNEQSIEGQFTDIYTKAEKENYVIIKEYVDEAMTGRNDNRPAFQQMIEDSKKGIFKAVFVWSIDRFARNRYLAAIYKHELRKNGVKLLYAAENIPDGPEGIMLEGILESAAEYFSEYNAQKSMRGKRETALKGKFNGGGVLWGYKLDENNNYNIDKQAAPIIKDMFEKYAAGMSSVKIAQYLNNNGIKTVLGTNWDNRKVLMVLRKKGYGGYYCWSDYCLEDKIPAIVDKETFERVQEKMQKNKAKAATYKAKEYYILSGKLFCGKCERKMTGNRTSSSRKNKNERVSYYSCSGRKMYKNCDMKGIRKDFIEALVLNEIKNFLSNNEMIEIIAEKIIKLLEKDKAKENLSDALQEQLNGVDKSLKNILKAVEQGIISDTVQTRLKELEIQKRDLTLKIQQEKLKENKPVLTKEHIMFFLDRFKNMNTDDEKTNEMVVETFVNKIYVDDKSLRIIFNISEGTKETKIDLKSIHNAENKQLCSVLDTLHRCDHADNT